MAIILLDTYKQGDERYSICRDAESNKKEGCKKSNKQIEIVFDAG